MDTVEVAQAGSYEASVCQGPEKVGLREKEITSAFWKEPVRPSVEKERCRMKEALQRRYTIGGAYQ